eukprot:6118968-Pyramimonas_sp.AAC.1
MGRPPGKRNQHRPRACAKGHHAWETGHNSNTHHHTSTDETNSNRAQLSLSRSLAAPPALQHARGWAPEQRVRS